MNIEDFRNYCIAKPGTTEELPFGPGIFVFKVLGKMYTTTMIDTFESISIKCDPEETELLRDKYDAVVVPKYMSKKHWNFVMMDGSIEDQKIYQWIDKSYELVIANLSKKQQQELKDLE